MSLSSLWLLRCVDQIFREYQKQVNQEQKCPWAAHASTPFFATTVPKINGLWNSLFLIRFVTLEKRSQHEHERGRWTSQSSVWVPSSIC